MSLHDVRILIKKQENGRAREMSSSRNSSTPVLVTALKKVNPVNEHCKIEKPNESFEIERHRTSSHSNKEFVLMNRMKFKVMSSFNEPPVA